MLSNIFLKIVLFMRQCGKYGRARQATGDSIIRRGRFACCVTKARDTAHCLFCLLKIHSFTL